MLAPATEDARQFWSDRQEQQFNDVADALADRNEAIAEAVTFDVLPFTTEQLAQLDAALRRGWIEDREMTWTILTDTLQAEIARRITAADRASVAATPRYPMTYCLQCGAALGPGNCGMSHCSDHQ